jgi:hypothetical protein
MANVTSVSLSVANLANVRVPRNSPMQKRFIIWVPAFAILAMALAVAGPMPVPETPAAEQRADR